MPIAQSSSASDLRVVAVPFLERSRGRALSLLTPAESAELAALGEPVRFAKGDRIYRSGAPADSLYSLAQGAAKTVQSLPGGGALVTRFLFAGDLLGLAEQGNYLEGAEAILPSVAHRIPLPAFAALLEGSGALAVRMICRLSHDLRETQRQSRILARNDAPGRVAMFFELLARANLPRGPGDSSYMPMSRSDLADFVGITIEAVSRALTELARLKILEFEDRHHFHVLDRERLQALADGAQIADLARPRAGAARRRAK